MPLCALCDCAITPINDSEEHIIPNSIGGRRKVKGFICKGCNSRSGDSWDVELARQLNPLSLILGISRDRGHSPSQIFPTTGGDEYIYNEGGKLSLSKPKIVRSMDGTREKISITARSLKEAKKLVQGYKKKDPNLDAEAAMKGAIQQSFYPSDALNISLNFGGDIVGRSLVKTALAFAVDSGVAASSCELAFNYLRDPQAPNLWD